MTIEQLNKKFTETVDVWKKSLESYSGAHFATKPDEESWSVGQVCQHLISSTKRVFIVIEKCLSSDTNEHEQKTDKGEKAFATNILSEEKVKVSLGVQPSPAQPESISSVKKEFEELKNNFAKLT